MVQVHGAIGADQGKVVGIERTEGRQGRKVFDRIILRDFERTSRPIHHLFDILEKDIAFGDGKILVHASGNGAGSMNFLTRRGLDDFLPVFAHHDPLDRKIGEFLRYADHVPDGGVGVKPEQQIGRYQMEELQGVGLEHLPVMHQAPDLFGRRGQLIDTGDEIHGLGGGQVMADRTDPAQPLNEHGDFPIGAALDEAFKTPEFHDMKPGLLNLIVFVQVD